MAEVDQLDVNIIGALQRNGRVPLTELAEQLGVSHGTIRNRLERLLAKGVLVLTAHVEPAEVGFPVRVFIGIKASLERLASVEKALTEFVEVTFVATMTGRLDILVGAAFTSHAHLREFLTTKLSKVKGIRDTETFHVLGYSKRIWQWVVPNSEKIRSANAGPRKPRRRGKG